MKKNCSLWMLASVLMICSCANTKDTTKILSMGRFEKNNVTTARIDRSLALYEMGEVDAGIANLTSLVEDTQYSPALDQAYELLVEWLLQVKRRDEAKRFASFFLKYHPNNPTSQKLIALFTNKEAQPPKNELPITQIQVVQEAPIPPMPSSESPGPLPDEKNVEALTNLGFVGVVLPLSGQFSVFGNRVLAAIKLAFNSSDVISNNDVLMITKNGLTLVIADSKSDPLVAEKVAEDLIKTHHALMLIGDITSESAINVAKVCQQHGVPQLSLARHPQILGYDKNVFLFTSSREPQIAALTKYAIESQGHKNFAIVFPKHKYGITMAKSFFDEVKRHGGKITAMESYEANETTFTRMADNLVGMHHLDARPEYVACKQAARAEKISIDQCKKELKPIIDFDAIFIPDFGHVSFLVPALIQRDLLVTKNPTAQRNYALATKNSNPKYVQLLGPNSWNDPSIVAKLANQVDGAYFVDSIDFSANDEIKTFAAAFLGLEMGMPTELEVYAHDAALFAIDILSHKSDEPMHERMARFNEKVGLLPRISFDKNQGLITPVTGFEIIGDSIRVATTNP